MQKKLVNNEIGKNSFKLKVERNKIYIFLLLLNIIYILFFYFIMKKYSYVFN